ncbi:MAG: hypothetical protein ACI3VQ_08420 [Faecousia sp.]
MQETINPIRRVTYGRSFLLGFVFGDRRTGGVSAVSARNKKQKVVCNINKIIDTGIRPITQEAALETLMDFLRCPLYDGAEVLRRFRALPGAQYFEGKAPLERYVYVPGTRKDRVLLIAHADTVWDQNYLQEERDSTPVLSDGRIISDTPEAGLGADDRAGCALLWLLKDSGHSLLIFDGEEHGHHGAQLLTMQNKRLLREINRHHWLLSLDLQGTNLCHYHGILNRSSFRKYIEEQFKPTELNSKAGTDVSYVAGQACGVNLSIGYGKQHRPSEFLSVSAWYECYLRLCKVLSQRQPRFRTRCFVRLRRKIFGLPRRIYRKVKRILHLK